MARYDSTCRKNIHTVLTSPKTFSANLADLPRLQKMLVQIPNLNRLPEANELTTMELLRSAWDFVDIYTYEADRMKTMAKFTYYVLMLLGLLISTVTVVSLNRPDLVPAEWLNLVVVGLSLTSSFIAGLITIVNPVTKWRQLRSAALALESEIWKFRTRSGSYMIAGSRQEPQEVEEKLHAFVDATRQHVLKSATISETAFLSHFNLFSNLFKPSHAAVYRHGQYSPCGASGTYGQSNPDRDDHHSPIRPEMYLELRVAPQLHFYQTRLPRYSCRRHVSEVVILLLTIGATLLAVAKLASWAAICTAVTAVVMAISEFNDTQKKLSRYSGTADQLQHVIMWWRGLPIVDKANVFNISTLVCTCEEFFHNEQNSWSSSSISSKLLSKAAADASTAADAVNASGTKD